MAVGVVRAVVNALPCCSAIILFFPLSSRPSLNVNTHTLLVSRRLSHIIYFPAPQIPDELPAILKEYTKEVIRSGVSADSVIQWSADYFAKKAAEQAAAAQPGENA